jgi:S-adenosylmethionine synthetase
VATDPIQILREAIVAVLDTHADVVAITGRATENVVAWGNLGDVSVANREAGIIAYHVLVSSEVAADQNPEDTPVQFGAVAAEESIANELVNVVRRVINGQAFQALVPPIDAFVTNRVRRPMPFDPEEKLARSDIDITIRAYFPALV